MQLLLNLSQLDPYVSEAMPYLSIGEMEGALRAIEMEWMRMDGSLPSSQTGSRPLE